MLNILALTILVAVIVMAIAFNPFVQRRWQVRRLLKNQRRSHPDVLCWPVEFIGDGALLASPISVLRLSAIGLLTVDKDQARLNGTFFNRLPVSFEFPQGCEFSVLFKKHPFLRFGMAMTGVDRTVYFRPLVGMMKDGRSQMLTELGQHFTVTERFRKTHTPLAMYAMLAAALICVAIAIAFTLFSSPPERTAAISSTSDNYVFSASRNALYRINPDQRLEKSWKWADLGHSGAVADLHAVSANEVLVGDFADGTIKTCDLAVGQCKSLPVFAADNYRFPGGFSFAFDPTSDSVFASDTTQHRLLRFDIDSIEAPQISEQSVCFPFRVRLTRDGRAFVADQNHHRILQWPAPGDIMNTPPSERRIFQNAVPTIACPLPGEGRFNQSHRVTALDFARGGRVWPLDIELSADGNSWVVVRASRQQQESADVLVFSPDWEPLRRVDLPRLFDPAHVTRDGDTMLVSSPHETAVYRFNADGSQQLPMDSDALTTMTRERDDAKVLREITGYALPAAACFFLLLAFCYYMRAMLRAAREHYLQRVGSKA